jgi:WxcM-like protein
MTREVESGAAYDDDRGRLVPVEFGGLPFDPRRCFVVAATEGRTKRGGHRAHCRELMVLVTGRVTVFLSSTARPTQQCVLARAGDRLLIEPDDQVDYVLDSHDATLLVLADRPFGAGPGSEG